jgi:hypothetical protein
VIPHGTPLTDEELRGMWRRERPLLELLTARRDGSWWVCEDSAGELVGYALMARFGGMEELSELMVGTSHQGLGVGHELLVRCWPEPTSPELNRVVVAAGAPPDLSLYTAFGVMPVTGHWHLRQRVEDYLELRSHEVDVPDPAAVALKPERAVEEWRRLEPRAIGHERPWLHDFFARTRSCLAVLDARGEARALCWVSFKCEIGPAVGASAEDLVPIVIAALDRVAKMQEPETLGVFCTTSSWWLLGRLRKLGFRVYWPSWVMSSVPLPGLDRYVPTRPARLL